jgi:dTDP-4-amino-4,6-dideoxygalactose transaminase
VLVDEKEYGESRDAVYERLRSHNVYGRRYFYPLISNFPTYRGLPSAGRDNLQVANRVSGQVICLPLYPHLGADVVEYICDLLGGGR